MNSKLEMISVWATIYKLKSVLHLSDTDLCNILELTSREYFLLKRIRKTPSLYSMMRLSEFLEIGFVPLITGNIDYPVLMKRLVKGVHVLPERYAKAAFSKRRTSIYMLNYVASSFSEGHRQNILRHHQLTDDVFQDPDAAINILFPMDLCEYLKKYRLMDESALIRMGRNSSRTSRVPVILNPLFELNQVKQIYELMCGELMEKYFEKNYFYRLDKISDSECTVVGTPNAEIDEQLGLKNAGSSAVCSLRSGFGSSFPDYIGLPYAEVKKTACVHQGDSQCRFEFNYEHAVKVLSHSNVIPIRDHLRLN